MLILKTDNGEYITIIDYVDIIKEESVSEEDKQKCMDFLKRIGTNEKNKSM